MHFPRRHRRKLFFPAGLLALAWLLPLGCGLIAAQPRLKQYGTMDLFVPPKAPLPVTYGIPLWLVQEDPAICDFSPAKLEVRYLWHTIQFSGNPWQDYLSTKAAQFTAHQLQLDPGHERGIRIEFGPASHYQQFISVLNLFSTENYNHYWFDFRNEPTILNGYVSPPDTSSAFPIGSCKVLRLPHFDRSATFAERLREVETQFPIWRYSVLLLLLLPLLALRQLWQLRA